MDGSLLNQRDQAHGHYLKAGATEEQTGTAGAGECHAFGGSPAYPPLQADRGRRNLRHRPFWSRQAGYCKMKVALTMTR
jgi:hypothetical protein